MNSKQIGRLVFALALLVSGGVIVWTQLRADSHSHTLIYGGFVAVAFGGFLLFPEDVKQFFGLFSLPFLRRRAPEPPDSDDVPPTA